MYYLTFPFEAIGAALKKATFQYPAPPAAAAPAGDNAAAAPAVDNAANNAPGNAGNVPDGAQGAAAGGNDDAAAPANAGNVAAAAQFTQATRLRFNEMERVIRALGDFLLELASAYQKTDAVNGDTQVLLSHLLASPATQTLLESPFAPAWLTEASQSAINAVSGANVTKMSRDILSSRTKG